ncbi:MAG TPA: Ig-like domain-containing protein [Gammaproteobacteria bacterium]
MIKVNHTTFWQTILHLGTAALMSLAALSAHAATSTQAPGGFMENDTAPVSRAALSATKISSFLPSRGSFTFPAPYKTQGIRVTNSNDCGGQDCLDMTYNYWKNMSNSAGSDTMYVFIGLNRARGGQGPTLFKYNKSTAALAEVGPMFAASDPMSKQTTEGWYFGYGMPTKIYLNSGSKLETYDIDTKKIAVVFDSTTKYPGTVIKQTNSSNDDDMHSATLQNASTYASEGCIAYQSSTKKWWFFAATAGYDECQIDKSGQYLEVKEKSPKDTCASCDEDDLVIDLKSGKQQLLLDKDGAGGHSDLGYGYMVASDNWNTEANAWRVWKLSDLVNGDLVYHGGTWGNFSPSHVSWSNASDVSTTPLSQQYVCGGAAVAGTTPGDNDVRCFTLGNVATNSQQSLVVAPVMTDLGTAGGDGPCPSCSDYGHDPKGNLDPTGQYFFWVSNMGGNRMDAFMVRIPTQVMGITAASSGVTITSPTSGAKVNGNLKVTASVPTGMQVAGVTFEVDGADATTATDAPYEATWDAGSLRAGAHTLTASATDTQGTTYKADPVNITMDSNGNVSTASGGGGGGGGSMSLIGLVMFGFIGLWRKLARSLRAQDAAI